jgi:small nuclear ribonucleoprotein (snRNP)-like protein
MPTQIGVPVKLLYECEGHKISVELTNGEVYRGLMVDAEDCMNIQMQQVVSKQHMQATAMGGGGGCRREGCCCVLVLILHQFACYSMLALSASVAAVDLCLFRISLQFLIGMLLASSIALLARCHLPLLPAAYL